MVEVQYKEMLIETGIEILLPNTRIAVSEAISIASNKRFVMQMKRSHKIVYMCILVGKEDGLI